MKIFGNNIGKSGKLKLIPLGGVGDVTKNMYVYETDRDIVIVDCGVGFPDEGMPGVDLVIPDISYLRDRKLKIRAILISHGHEDHIGGLPYIWPELQVPIYTRKLTAGFIRNKFAEHRLPKDKIFEVKMDDQLKFGDFNVSFYEVSHSVPDTMGIVLDTPGGLVIHQSDFKIDWTPVSGQVTDVGRIAQLGARGVSLLLMDCLRVEKPGFNKSERSIEATFATAASETKGKLLITMTSSNVSRMQQAINVAAKQGRKVALVGRSFESNFQVARDLGYLSVPSGIIIPAESIPSVPDEKLLILIAGSQGQPGSALSRVANGEHKQIHLERGDGVIFSADPIPNTETAQSALIDNLMRMDVRVYYSAITSDVHVSGHAASDELKLMVNLIKPQFMLPIGGEYRHMKLFSKMCQDMSYKPEQIIDAIDGDVITLENNTAKVTDNFPVNNIYIDGLGVGDVGTVVLRDRQVMSEEGVVVVVIPIAHQTGQLDGEPDIISRGFIFEKEQQELIDEARELVKKTLKNHAQKLADWRYMRKIIEEELEKFLYQATERRPLILPIVVEV